MIQSFLCFPICDQSQLDRRMGDYFRDNLVHLADGEDFNPKGTSSQCNAFQSDNTMWGDNLFLSIRTWPIMWLWLLRAPVPTVLFIPAQNTEDSAQSLCRFSRECCKYTLFQCCKPIVIEFCKVLPICILPSHRYWVLSSWFWRSFPFRHNDQMGVTRHNGQIVKTRQRRTTVPREIYKLPTEISL